MNSFSPKVVSAGEVITLPLIYDEVLSYLISGVIFLAL
jgi:hypothetical protein